MESFFMPIILGIFCVIIGVFNINGHIGSIHWYHRKRVREEDRRPFGKWMGIGTMVIGGGLMIFGALSWVAERFENDEFRFVGTIILLLGTVVGLGLSFFAMIKYNKGIF